MPGEQSCKDQIDPIVDAMKAAKTGSYIALEEQTSIFETIDKLEPKRPNKIAILMGKKCGSSCEQFLLTARQSYSVKLVGQRSYGALDYSNLRPHLLPSEQLTLYYATSRSQRLPDMPVDVLGVLPDIYLAPTSNEEAKHTQVKQVQTWLEGGEL